MSPKNFASIILCSASIVLLSACGGGGDSSPTLNLNAAFSTYTIGGSTRSGTISGYCQGTREEILSPTSSGTTLNGTTPALIQNEYERDIMAANSNAFCTNFYSHNDITQVKGTYYYDPNLMVPISNGSNPPGTVYQNQIPFPTSVTAGSSSAWFNTVSYVDGLPPLRIPAATSFQTWEVAADSSTTLMLITNNKAYTTVGNQLLFNQTTWYRINANNTLTALRKNIQVTELGIFVFSGGTIVQPGIQNIDEVYQ